MHVGAYCLLVNTTLLGNLVQCILLILQQSLVQAFHKSLQRFLIGAAGQIEGTLKLTLLTPRLIRMARSGNENLVRNYVPHLPFQAFAPQVHSDDRADSLSSSAGDRRRPWERIPCSSISSMVQHFILEARARGLASDQLRVLASRLRIRSFLRQPRLPQPASARNYELAQERDLSASKCLPRIAGTARESGPHKTLWG